MSTPGARHGRALPALSRHAVDRNAAVRSDEAALDAAWASERARLLLLTADGRTPVSAGALMATRPSSPARPAEAFYLGTDPSAEWFALSLDADAQQPEGALEGLREVGADLAERDAGLLTHAVALQQWHRTHLRCPRCGAPTAPGQGGHTRICTVDGSEHFPRTDPAVIMLITDPGGSAALLGRQPAWPAGLYSCLAGFVEAGESAEQAVVRETAEEAGIAVRNVRYVASQPWPFPASLMLGFRATADPAEPLNTTGDELEDARWFSRGEIAAAVGTGALLPPPVSIARHMICEWLAESDG